MRALVLWADESSANLGVRVLAVGTEALLRRSWPDIEVTHQNFGGAHPHLPIGRMRSLLRERVTGRRGMMKWLSGFDLVVDTRSGDSFADIYGLRRLRIMSAVAEFATEAGVPVVLGPQTIGPFDTRTGRALGRFSMKRSAVTMARDSVSADYARQLGSSIDVLTTDVVFALPVPKVERSRDVILNISGLLWNPSPHVDASAYRQVVATLYKELIAQGREVTLLAHVLDSANADNDVPAIRQFASMVTPTADVVIPCDLEDARATIASANLVVGSRMHACLNALSVGTPSIPLAYSRKFEPLLGDLGWNHIVDLRGQADPVASVLEMIGNDSLQREIEAVPVRAEQLLSHATRALNQLR